MEEMKPIGFVAAMNAMSVKLIKPKRKNMIAWIIGLLEERRKKRDILFH